MTGRVYVQPLKLPPLLLCSSPLLLYVEDNSDISTHIQQSPRRNVSGRKKPQTPSWINAGTSSLCGCNLLPFVGDEPVPPCLSARSALIGRESRCGRDFRYLLRFLLVRQSRQSFIVLDHFTGLFRCTEGSVFLFFFTPGESNTTSVRVTQTKKHFSGSVVDRGEFRLVHPFVCLFVSLIHQ